MLGSDSGPGGRWVTGEPASGALIGVLATAQSDGRYAVDLSLVADMVPLPALAEDVRARVRKRVDGEQLEDVLGAVNVEFAYVMTAEEFAATAAEEQIEEAILAEELVANAAVAEEVAHGSRSVQGEAAEAAPAGPDAGAALAARQAALATDQAALAAQQAALAAELAALAGARVTQAGERAALAAEPGAPRPSLEGEPAAGSAAEDDGEGKR